MQYVRIGPLSNSYTKQMGRITRVTTNCSCHYLVNSVNHAASSLDWELVDQGFVGVYIASTGDLDCDWMLTLLDIYEKQYIDVITSNRYFHTLLIALLIKPFSSVKPFSAQDHLCTTSLYTHLHCLCVETIVLNKILNLNLNAFEELFVTRYKCLIPVDTLLELPPLK